MLPTEKQLTANASENAIEEVYTNHDISIQQTTYDPLMGYPYQYPVRWLNDPSGGKRIGLRSIEVIPPAMMFTLVLYVKKANNAESNRRQIFDITSSNTLKEILNEMSRVFTFDETENIDGVDTVVHYQLKYLFDDKNNLQLYVTSSTEGVVLFKIVNTNREDTEDLLKFLNQDITTIKGLLTSYSFEKNFSNVWDRENLFVHASFCTTNRHYLGKNHESHDSPNKLYPGPTNDSTFYLRFTSNHITNLLPRHTIYTIELSFILNYRRSIVL